MVLQTISARDMDSMVASTLKLGISILNGGNATVQQNYLRTQTGNNTTVNIVISTVDYLLRLQESISDFYWFYSGKAVIDNHGRRSFSKAISAAKQVFILCFSNVEMILRFFDMFLKLKGLTSSDAFREYDPEGLGCVSRKDFQRAMEGCKRFSPPEVHFLMSCTDADGLLLDYVDFVDRFHEPATDIGFSLAVLLTNLSEHMPRDARLATFLELAQCIITYFEPYLGRIEIMGGAKRIERVYFEISGSSRAQWDKPQVKESKRQFIFDVVNEGGEKEKMEMFVNFCEDTIFEMQLASQISGSHNGQRSSGNNLEDEEENGNGNNNPNKGNEPGTKPGSARENAPPSTLSVKNARKRMKRMTARDLLAVAASLVRFVVVATAALIGGVIRGVLYALYVAFVDAGLVEGAKRTGVLAALGSIPEPTLDEVTEASVQLRRRRSSSCQTDGRWESGEAAAAATTMAGVGAGSAREVDRLSDIFGMRMRKEGGQYRFLADDLTASLADLSGANAVGQSGSGQPVPGEHQAPVSSARREDEKVSEPEKKM
ncbi:hypothetical protein CRUP_010030 [Coryphaenoides rupestris]|nr:hypothetical protein CRUP_010030 [Coryphaenoides rupestris]